MEGSSVVLGTQRSSGRTKAQASAGSHPASWELPLGQLNLQVLALVPSGPEFWGRHVHCGTALGQVPAA